MEVIVAKNAGFCFGVKRAIEETYKILDSKKGKVYSAGSIIHNEIVTNELKEKGLVEIGEFSELLNLKDETVIIRTHGVEKKLYEALLKNNNKIIDLTCPFVKKIHNIVDEYSKKAYKIIVVGDKNHPEVKGIVSYGDNTYVVSDANEATKLPIDREDKVALVFQTTADISDSKNIVAILREFYYNIEVINTICNTTIDRQEEVMELAKVLDVVIVVGSTKSSNTMKLYNIASAYCASTYIVSSVSDLKEIKINNDLKVGVCAGASTPQYLIEEIINNVRNEF